MLWYCADQPIFLPQFSLLPADATVQ